MCVCICIRHLNAGNITRPKAPQQAQVIPISKELPRIQEFESGWDFETLRLEIFWGFQMDVPKGSSGSSCLWHPLRLQPQLHQPQQTQGAEDAGNSDDLSSGFTHNVCDMYVTCNYVTYVCVCHHEKSIMKRNKGNPGKLMLKILDK